MPTFRGWGRLSWAEATGAEVRVTDSLPPEQLGIASDVPGGESWLGSENPAVLEGADLVVTSPGVPPDQGLLAQARQRGLLLRSELELGWWFVTAPTVAITWRPNVPRPMTIPAPPSSRIHTGTADS